MPTRPFPRAIAAFVATFATAFVALALLAPDAAAAPSRLAVPVVRVLAEDLRGVRLEYVAGGARWDTLAVGDARYERVHVRGTVMVEPPGRPA
ncbi:MAG TPA: hypothetical protein VJ776_02175, partial [Thermoanaerobaculia bacterium]|nr:hypothetical protein [Thermoanaerobaculia bacterium]